MAKRLKWVEYDYTVQIGPGNSWIYRPLIPVEISSGVSGRGVQLDAMIDSGTDSTVLDADIARKLQIDLASCKTVRLGGIGTIQGHLTNIRLTVTDLSIVMDIPVIFAENLPMPGLVGQRHFFQRVRVRFEKDRNKFFLAPAP